MNAKKPRVAIYARVSTNDQRADLQLDALRQLAEQRGWTIHAEYVDAGYSGTKDRRPALDRLMGDARRGTFGIVAVWRFDRFGRSLRHLVTALDEFRDLGIQFVSAQDAIDTARPHLLLLFSIVCPHRARGLFFAVAVIAVTGAVPGGGGPESAERGGPTGSESAKLRAC